MPHGDDTVFGARRAVEDKVVVVGVNGGVFDPRVGFAEGGIDLLHEVAGCCRVRHENVSVLPHDAHDNRDVWAETAAAVLRVGACDCGHGLVILRFGATTFPRGGGNIGVGHGRKKLGAFFLKALSVKCSVFMHVDAIKLEGWGNVVGTDAMLVKKVLAVKVYVPPCVCVLVCCEMDLAVRLVARRETVEKKGLDAAVASLRLPL